MGNGGFCPEFIEKKPEKEYCKSSKQILGNNSGYCIVESHRRIYDRTSPVSYTHLAFAGFVVVGLGAANLIPLLFTIASR